MDVSSKPKTKRIAFLILLSLILPFIAYIGAEVIEEEFFSSRKAGVFWLFVILLGLMALTRAHILAVRTTNFRALYPILILSTIGFAWAFGWHSSSAWYNIPTFYDYTSSGYKVEQNKDHPNQFLFSGLIKEGAEDTVIRTILGAENVDWDKPIALELVSDGGSPQEAILIGEFVRHYNIQVEVVLKCISACTTILMASEHRYVHPRAWIGFHATYMDKPDAPPSYEAPSLKFFDEIRDEQLSKLGASSEFREHARVQDAEVGFFATYEQLKAESIINVTRRLYEDETKPPGYL